MTPQAPNVPLRDRLSFCLGLSWFSLGSPVSRPSGAVGWWVLSPEPALVSGEKSITFSMLGLLHDEMKGYLQEALEGRILEAELSGF